MRGIAFAMPEVDSDEQRRWIDAVTAIIDRAQEWARQRGWRSALQTMTLTEDRLGTYQVPVLTVESDQGKIVLEPVARWTSPGEGRIDVYSWPSLNRLMLLRNGDGWELFTEAAVRWPRPWTQA